MPNTIMHYMYRDGANFKKYSHVILNGAITDEQKQRILAALDDGEYFIPEQVGLTANRWEDYGYDPNVDHWFCELHASDFEHTDLPATVDITIDELVRRFETAKSSSLGVFGWETELNQDYVIPRVIPT